MREPQVLQLIADGFGSRAIATALYVSEETVKTHVQRVLRKLGASSRANAVAIGLRVGLPVARRFVETRQRSLRESHPAFE